MSSPQEQAPEAAKRRGITALPGRLAGWAIAVALFVLAYYFSSIAGPLSLMAIVYGFEGVADQRLRVTKERDVRGSRARGLGLAWMAWAGVTFLCGFFEKKLIPVLVAHGIPEPAAACAFFAPFLALWALSLFWSSARSEPTKPGDPGAALPRGEIRDGAR
jgi:UDP-N-acetylmuramyl pentapeptide phosphotransferase/UDP-N-acetylglucosamine-1-phosphate transferase